MAAPAQSAESAKRPAAEVPSQILAASPILGVLAGLAAIVDLLFNHGIVRSLTDVLDHPAHLTLSNLGGLSRNLAAVAGFVALAVALTQFLSAPRKGRITRGMGLAGFGGIFLPIVAVATILPPEFLARRWTYLIVFAVGAGNVLTILISTTGARRPGPLGLRLATALLVMGSLLSFTAIVLGRLPAIAHTGFGASTLVLMGRLGEAAWLSIPLAAASTIVPRPGKASGVRTNVAFAVGVASTLLVLAGGLWAHSVLGADFGTVVYGITGGELFIETAPSLYVLVLALGVGIGFSALATGNATVVQAGAGVLLILAGGFTPAAPLRLLTLVLGACLLTRASICLGERGILARHAAEHEKERASFAELDRSLSDAPDPAERT